MKHKGQMLIEVVVAVGILALVLVGITDLMTRSSRVLTYQRDREGAYAIAREILNDYRSGRDENPITFFDDVTGLSREVCVEGKKYGCEALVTEEVGGVLIDVSVYWNDGSNRYEIKLSQNLTEQ